MKTPIVCLATIVLIVSASTGSQAKNSGKLPKGAVPLTEAQVHALYDGKSVDWKVSQVRWNADGTAIGYYPKKGNEGFGDGTWTVKGNEMCSDMKWRGDVKAEAPFEVITCQTLFYAGKKMWVVETKNEDKYLNDVWTGLEKKLTSKDLVTKNYNAIKVKFGY